VEQSAAASTHALTTATDAGGKTAGDPDAVRNDSHLDRVSRQGRAGRTFVFVSALEPLAAAQAIWSAPTPVDLCVAAPSRTARETAAFAVAGRPVATVLEPLLAAPREGQTGAARAARAADALLALYALDTRTALVVWDDPETERWLPPVADEWWLLDRAERIGRGPALR